MSARQKSNRLFFQLILTLLLLSIFVSIGLLLTTSVSAEPLAVAPRGDSCQDSQKLKNVHFAEECYWRSFFVDETGNVPIGGMQKAYAQVQQQRAARPKAPAGGGITGVGSWTAIGPGNIGGRIRSVVRDPGNANTIWIGSVGGGVFKTTDGGANWSTTTDFLASLAVSTMVISPINSSILYAGTGEGFGNGDALRGAGIFKTIDGGTTWNQLASTSVPGANCDWCNVNRIAISPNGATLLAVQNIQVCGQAAIWRSTDGGANWSNVAPACSLGMNYVQSAQFVAFDPTNSLKAVASGVGGAWYSTDGGATWTAATFNAPGHTAATRVELAYAASSPNIVYASIDQIGGELWKSIDSGVTYSRINTGSSLLGGQGWYDNALWVNPFDVNFVVVGGTQIWISTNGGTTFTTQGYGAGMHPDHHAIIADPGFDNNTNKIVYVGNDGGIYKTSDITASPVGALVPAWTSLNINLPITQYFSGVGHNTLTSRITGGTQDNGTPGTSTSGFNSWVDWTSGDGGYVAVDNTDATGNTWYGEYVYLTISRSNAPFPKSWSVGGRTDIYAGNPPGGCGALGDAGISTNALFIAPFILDPNNASRLLGGGMQVWLSANPTAATPCWGSIKSSIGTKISAIAVAPGNSDVIWVGYTNGRVDMTTNGTSGSPTWTQVGSGTLPNRQVTRIAIDATNSNNAYVTFSSFGTYTSGNVWRTTNAGTNWTDISTGLPSVPVFSITINPNNHNFLYIGTALGVYDTQNGLLGAPPTWSTNDGPANVAVTELSWVGTGSAPKLLAATHGRSMWITTNGVTEVTLEKLTASTDTTTQNLLSVGFSAIAGMILIMPLGSMWYSRRKRKN